MLTLVLLSIALVTFVAALYELKYRNRNYWAKRNVVCVDQGNPLGVLWQFIFENRSLSEIYKDVYDKYQSEPYVGIYMGSKPALILRSPENIKAVLVTEFQNFHSRGLVINDNDVLAQNVLFLEDFKKWKILRQKVSPLFTSSRLKNMFYIMEHCAKDFVSFVEQNKELQEDPFAVLRRYSTGSLGASVFGIDTQVQNTLESPYLEMAWKAVAPSFMNNFRFNFASSLPFLFRLLKVKIFGTYERFFLDIFKKALKSRYNDNSTSKHDFLDLCIEIQKKGTMKDRNTNFELEPTDEILAAQAFFFFLAGADTSANTVHFILMEIARHPEVQKKVLAEIDEIFDRCQEKITYDDLEDMPYLTAVTKEAMRMFPSVGQIPRECNKDTVLPDGGLKVEKGTLVIAPVYGLHKDEKYFPNPDKFDPERFLGSNEANITNFTYLPFGEGNRICIGERYSRLQMKIGIAWLLRRFSLEPISPLPETFEKSFFSLRATDVKYRLRRRNGNRLQ